MMLKRGLLVLFLFLVSGCDVKTECVAAGCSGQICTTAEKASDLITTCEWKEEYGCFEFTECGFLDGECKWKETEEYSNCLNEVK